MSHETYAPCHKCKSSDTRLLYVVLRGEFVLLHDVQASTNKQLRILAPALDDHEYQAGAWNNLSPINADGDVSPTKDPAAPYCLSLEHVTGDRAAPEATFNLMYKLGDPARSDATPFLDISAPLPIAILAGRMEDTKSVFVYVMDATGKVTFPRVPPSPTVIPILVYRWCPCSKPCLALDGDDNVKFYPGGGDYYPALHIFATGPGHESRKHIQHAFSKAAALLGLNAKVDWDDKIIGKDPIFVVPPPGLSWDEANLTAPELVLLRRLRSENEGLSAEEIWKIVLPQLFSLGSGGNCGPSTHGHDA